MTSPDEAPLDLEMIEATWGGEPEVVREILGSFLDSGHEDITALQRAVSDRDPQACARWAHRLAGAGKMVGAVALASIGKEIESAARSADWTEVEHRLAHFTNEWVRICAWVHAL